MQTPSYLINLASFSELRASLLTANGQIEFLLGLVLFIGSFFLFRATVKKNLAFSEKFKKVRRFRNHLKYRLVWPAFLTIILVIASIIWFEISPNHQVIWLAFFTRAAIWLGMIRIIMAMIRYTISNNFFDATMENYLSIMLWGCFLLWLSGLGSILLGWLDSIRLPIGKSSISLLSISSGIFWVGITLILALWCARIIESHIMRLKSIDINARIVINKLISITLIILAILVTLPMVGIDLTVMSVFGGALGVGLGFGLQKIASSYVSGFIILLERSLRLGDMVEINNCKGIVNKITSRYVVLRATGGSNFLIPNDSIISNTVTNLSLTDRSIWAQVDVQVAYETDLDFAMKLLVEAATHERISLEPGPTPYLISFGDSGINMAIGFWVKDSERSLLGLKSDISMNIWRSFKAHGIQMPFPQREVHILNHADDEQQDKINGASTRAEEAL